MKKHPWFIILLTGLLALVSAGCGPQAETSASLPEDAGAQPFTLDQLVATDPGTVQLAAGQVHLVEFFAYWWTVCQRMAPIVHGLQDEYSGQMQFTYLDIDNPETRPWMDELNYLGRPYFVLFDAEGNVLNKWSGYVPEETLRTAFEEALGGG
jgi:thioredoxin 1